MLSTYQHMLSRSSAYPSHKLTLAGFDHPQGQGTIKYYNHCNVKWNVYVPLNTARYPFICLVSRGNHLHHPPRPTRLPFNLKEDILEFISKDDVLALTKGMLRTDSVYA
jgi:hypothetical protein